MIKVVMTRSTNNYWYKIRTISDLDALIDIFREEEDLIIQENWCYKTDPEEIVKYWDGMTLEDAKEVSECEIDLEIYDGYRE